MRLSPCMLIWNLTCVKWLEESPMSSHSTLFCLDKVIATGNSLSSMILNGTRFISFSLSQSYLFYIYLVALPGWFARPDKALDTMLFLSKPALPHGLCCGHRHCHFSHVLRYYHCCQQNTVFCARLDSYQGWSPCSPLSYSVCQTEQHSTGIGVITVIV